MKIEKQKQNKTLQSKAWAIWSLILTLVPLFVVVYFRIKIGLNETPLSSFGNALHFASLVYNYWWIELLIAIVAVVFAAIGLKSKLRWLSIITLCIEIIVIFTLLFFFVFRRDLI